VTALRALAPPHRPERLRAGPAVSRPRNGKSPVFVVVPGAVNYFYNRAGQRIAAAARAVGVAAEVHTLQTLGNREGGCVLLLNPPEAVAGHPVQEEGLARVRALLARHDRVAAVSLECARTHWYADLLALCRSAGIDTLIDLGFVSQYDAQPAAARSGYRFVVNGLTAGERRSVKWQAGPGERPIPWMFVGHHSAERANLVARLLCGAAPGGLVYLPALSPVADGGPHIGERSFLRALGRAEVQVWCSHHDHFYIESERFRMSLLAGNIPVKAVSHPPSEGPVLPFHYLMPTVEHLPTFLRDMDLAATWSRFADDFLALPSLEDAIAETLADLGVTANGPRANGAAPKARPVREAVGR
jgi:hypothetical protein